MRVRATPHRLNEIKPLDGSIRGGISDSNTRPGPETTRLEWRGRREGISSGGWMRKESRVWTKGGMADKVKRRGWGGTREERKTKHT